LLSLLRCVDECGVAPVDSLHFFFAGAVLTMLSIRCQAFVVVVLARVRKDSCTVCRKLH